MADNTHRKAAEAARAAATASVLPSVRERNMRSAAAFDEMVDREEVTATKLKARQAEAAERRASGMSAEEDENDDGGEMD
jgi:hypothetical protein